MGDHALVAFKSGSDVSPVVYLHWAGHNVADWIKEAAPLLRRGDDSYAAARFCGFCHDKMPNRTTGLGLLAPLDAEALANLESASHGDAGVFLVDLVSGDVTAAGGYGESFKIDPETFGK